MNKPRIAKIQKKESELIAFDSVPPDELPTLPSKRAKSPEDIQLNELSTARQSAVENEELRRLAVGSGTPPASTREPAMALVAALPLQASSLYGPPPGASPLVLSERPRAALGDTARSRKRGMSLAGKLYGTTVVVVSVVSIGILAHRMVTSRVPSPTYHFPERGVRGLSPARDVPPPTAPASQPPAAALDPTALPDRATAAPPVDTKAPAEAKRGRPTEESSATAVAPAASAEPAAPRPARASDPGDDPNLDVQTALRLAGDAARERGNGRARKLYMHVLSHDGSNCEAWAGMGRLARSEGDTADALQSFMHAVEANPRFFPAALAVADLEWERGDRVNATSRYAALRDAFPREFLPPRVGERAP
jgi:Tfp pilus assembly protein PilF